MEITEFLADYPVDIAGLTEQLRTFVKLNAPNCTETLHTGWRVISYGHKKKFCAIAPHAKWVNLQFHQGASLTDPDGLLQGAGKSMRHVKIAQPANLNTALANLIRNAASAA